jgi:hypothetical protein
MDNRDARWRSMIEIAASGRNPTLAMTPSVMSLPSPQNEMLRHRSRSSCVLRGPTPPLQGQHCIDEKKRKEKR